LLWYRERCFVQHRWAVCALTVTILTVVPSWAAACVCVESKGLAADYREARAVFAGTVVALEIVRKQVEGHVLEDMVATFKVGRRWKGPKKAHLRIRTCGTQTMICTCGTNFRLGAHFVVFAVEAPMVTGSCQRATEYHPGPEPGLEWVGAEELVKHLDRLAGPASKVTEK
jgi:hypothetical protein